MSAPPCARRSGISLLLAITFALVFQPYANAQQQSARSPRPLLPAPRLLGEPSVLTLPRIDWPRAVFPDIVTQLAAARPNGLNGVLFETLDGQIVAQQNANQFFNPASATKIATALAALKTFGPQHRFSTVLWTNGVFDPLTGTITGDLYLSGRDPAFHDEHAVALAQELNRLGIKIVTGDLLVPFGFTLNFNSSAQRSGERLYDTLDAMRRPPSATRAWLDERVALRDTASLGAAPPSVAVMGGVGVEAVPAGARTLLTHRSSKLIDILK
ncbi:MAG TPA: D-alanyl-D-alanine carboxypeptidase, partial [Pyrinomonadaceae bacterium]|nr:D-alanyl-D-alanine carboxypeptidase [Pyrinomonadaceae bacterium]